MRKTCSSAALEKTRINLGECAEGADHQTGTNGQDQREGHLNNHENGPGRDAVPCFG